MLFNRAKYDFIITGLGNPGSKYQGTRHNIGFAAIDYITENAGIEVKKKKFDAFTGEGILSGKKILFIKPLTFMNLSGQAVSSAIKFYKMTPEKLIVIFDDVNFDPGQLRIKQDGSSGGHNGLKSIEASIGTQKYKRIKIGVGKKPPEYDLADWVLGKLGSDDSELIRSRFRDVKTALELIVAGNIEKAMNLYNRD